MDDSKNKISREKKNSITTKKIEQIWIIKNEYDAFREKKSMKVKKVAQR